CVVTDELLDSIKTENDKTKLALEKRFGKDWKVKYNQEFEDFQMKQVDVMDVMISNESFRKQLEKCNIPIDGINKNVKKIGNSDKYNVDIFDYKNHEKICFTTEVDIKLRTIKIK
ncbi:hypothetical protein AB4Y90_17230, partial [Chryseobacterium sp. 2TAF14]|uniref:hypothetical protein n=1 Tax=Chryseobacterium sp. 2TAF14 TaxID=3233007 RepID=UPI003F91F4C3